LLKRSCHVEADLLLHLGEIDERKLYLARAHPSMFAFCVEELGFSEDAAYNRIFVARAARRLPALIEALRSGKVHLGGLRLLAPLLTVENHLDVLARAAGRSKRQLAEIVERGLDLLIEKVEKERFAVGRQPKKAVEDCIGTSRHVPDPIRRAVYERDGGRCAFVDGQGRRCPATESLELDHLDGWAR